MVKGGNYGWPVTEGKFDSATMPQFEQPLFVYIHDLLNGATSTSRAITVGDFGSETSFPAATGRAFFFADYAQGWIHYVQLARQRRLAGARTMPPSSPPTWVV